MFNIELLIQAAQKTKSPSYREALLNAVAMAMPEGSIRGQVRRWTLHRIKQLLNPEEALWNTSWSNSIENAISDIRSENHRSRKTNYAWYYCRSALEEFFAREFERAVKHAWNETVASQPAAHPLMKRFPKLQKLQIWAKEWQVALCKELIKELIAVGAVGEYKKSVESQLIV